MQKRNRKNTKNKPKQPDNSIPRNNLLGSNQVNTLQDSSILGADDPEDSIFNEQETSEEKKGRSFKSPVKLIKTALKLFLLILILTIVYLGIKFVWTAKNSIDSSFGGAPALADGEVEPERLTVEGDGRINILFIGIGGDNHDGGNLSDTNLIATVDPVSNSAGMFSIPRDTYVEIPNYGFTRINQAHALGEDNGEEGGGPKLLSDTIEKNFNIPIHYYVRLDLNGFESAIDAVDGIELFVEEQLVDNIYSEAELGYPGPFIVEQGQQQFDGRKALLYARSRSTSARGDFDRNDRQRDILIALKDKALSLGTFSSPTKLSSLLSATSGSVKTNVGFSEIKPLYDIVQRVDSSLIKSTGLSTDNEQLLIDANINGAAVLSPAAGPGNYSDITKFFFSNYPDRYLKQESASVAVYNATEIDGYATLNANTLEAFGYNITDVDNFDGLQSGNKLYRNTVVDSPYTENYLSNRYKTPILNSSEVPSSINTQADYIIVLGEKAEE